MYGRYFVVYKHLGAYRARQLAKSAHTRRCSRPAGKPPRGPRAGPRGPRAGPGRAEHKRPRAGPGRAALESHGPGRAGPLPPNSRAAARPGPLPSLTSTPAMLPCRQTSSILANKLRYLNLDDTRSASKGLRVLCEKVDFHRTGAYHHHNNRFCYVTGMTQGSQNCAQIRV